MKIQALQVPPIGTNCYLLMDEKTAKGAIIDPGGNAQGIAAVIEQLGMTPAAILLTHGHYDHTGAVPELREKYLGIPVYLHAEDAAMTKRIDSLMPDVGETTDYGEGDEIAVGDLTVHVYHTPGHSNGSVTLEVEDVLFTGDTLFQGSCGRTDLAGGSSELMVKSLKRLANMEGDRQVLPGHEGFSTLAQERANNYWIAYALKS